LNAQPERACAGVSHAPPPREPLFCPGGGTESSRSTTTASAPAAHASRKNGQTGCWNDTDRNGDERWHPKAPDLEKLFILVLWVKFEICAKMRLISSAVAAPLNSANRKCLLLQLAARQRVAWIALGSSTLPSSLRLFGGFHGDLLQSKLFGYAVSTLWVQAITHFFAECLRRRRIVEVLRKLFSCQHAQTMRSCPALCPWKTSLGVRSWES